MTPVLACTYGFLTTIDGISYATFEPLSDESMLIRLKPEQAEQLETCERIQIQIEELELYQFLLISLV